MHKSEIEKSSKTNLTYLGDRVVIQTLEARSLLVDFWGIVAFITAPSVAFLVVDDGCAMTD